MKMKWSYLLVLSLFIQPSCSLAKWKQIPESPFAIKAEPCNGETNNGPRQVSYSPDGAFLAVANACDASGSGAESGSVSMFSVEKQTGYLTELENSPFSVETTGGANDKTLGLAFSPSGIPTLATANRNDIIKLFSFNVQTGDLYNLRPVNAGTCNDTESSALTYSPSGKYLASVSTSAHQANIYKANQATGDLTCQQEATSSFSVPRSAAYYPTQSDHSFLVVANSDIPTIDIVIFTASPETGIISNPKNFSLKNGQDIFPHWIDFSPDGNFLAIAVIDGVEVRKFRATGINAPTLLPLNNSTSFFSTPANSRQDLAGVRSVAYSPDGRWLAAANSNETISIFCVDQETGALFNRQDLTVGRIGDLGTGDLTFSVAFSPDSKYLAVSNRDDNSISVFTNPSANCTTCSTMLNLSNNSSCAACTSS